MDGTECCLQIPGVIAMLDVFLGAKTIHDGPICWLIPTIGWTGVLFGKRMDLTDLGIKRGRACMLHEKYGPNIDLV